MATYAIGDLQGCYQSLMGLLEAIDYSSNDDQLWFTGDLVNRGPKSLACLKFIESLGSKAITVLGNHDLHLLAVARKCTKARSKDTFDDILKSKKNNHLVEWLHHQPLFHLDSTLNACMTHAGIPPQWSLKKAQQLAHEIEGVLQDPYLSIDYFYNMYGNIPAGWDNSLEGTDRYRTITNYFTRMRILDSEHAMEFSFKNDITQIPKGYMAWFNAKRKENLTTDIIFGHWAALMGKHTPEKIHAIDTGCAWGHTLTALRLEDKKRFSHPFSE